MFKRILRNTGLVESYESSRTNKITMHSFRSYFFTKATRKHGDNYAHKMTGHGGYLMQYDRMTDEEKRGMYLELEPDLIIDSSERQKTRITELERNAEEIQELTKKVEEIKDQQFETQKFLTHSVTESMFASLDEFYGAGRKIPKGNEKAWERRIVIRDNLLNQIKKLEKVTGKKYQVTPKIMNEKKKSILPKGWNKTDTIGKDALS